MSKPKLNPAERKSVRKVIDYLWNDEQKHWLELDRPKEHIYLDLVKLDRLLATISEGEQS